ncbi:DUF1737 domain-containing protein [Ruania zhangjianzhongii]|uniref:DUF1737 domain-containing protein n=1 Tax=Ruania zhangjianzhongii TaxID=2603206 RepID=UPI0011CBC070|nr:DUF1737 domain-containing protein [Ruania zhangjianzhongii]
MSDAGPSTAPPGHRYRLLTGPDDATFCARVSDALAEGYQLYGSPSLTFDGERVVAAQAVLWPGRATQAGAADAPPAPHATTNPAAAPTTTSPQNGDDR